MAEPVTEVWCILVNHNFEPIGGAFPVEVPSNGFVLDVMVKAKERSQNDLARVDAYRLEVWRLRNPRVSTEIKRSLPNLIRLGEVLFEGEDEAARLIPAKGEILLHFSGLQRAVTSALVRVAPPSQIGGSPDNKGEYGEYSINLLGLRQLIVSGVHVVIQMPPPPSPRRSWTEAAAGGRSGPGHEIHSRHSIRSAGTV